MGDTTVEARASEEALGAHAAWLARGRSGEGRLVLEGATITASLEGRDLRFAELSRVTFEGVTLAGAQLEGARFTACSFERADLRHASALDARFEDCDLRKATVAGLVLGRTGFLRCSFGDFASQPIGKPDVREAYFVLTPDLSAKGDGSRVGHAADVDLRWCSRTREPGRRLLLRGADDARMSITVLDMHLRYTLEAGARFHEHSMQQTFAQMIDAGVPEPFRGALDEDAREKLTTLVHALASSAPVEGEG